MKKYTILIILIFSLIGYAQNGINYKAVINDNDGNVLANQPVTAQFSILQGVAQTNVYEETHTPTTDDNGIIIINIGEGTTTDVFTDIDWASDDHFLNVQIDTGSGLVDLGTTQFKAVPYALNANNVNGLEAIDEGNGVGWRLVGRNPDNYGDVGLDAVDLSYNHTESTERGATGAYSTTLGGNTTASASYATATGRLTNASSDSATAMGEITLASGDISTAMGNHTVASGNISTALGFETDATGDISLATGAFTLASGNYSTAFGHHTRSRAFNSVAIGRYNVGFGNSETWEESSALFEIGNGTSDANRRNALTVNKNGSHYIISSAIGLSINAESVGLSVFGSGNSGIVVGQSEIHGAVLEGKSSGLLTRSSISENPDIILAGNSNNNDEDDGIIISDPNYSGSDIFLISNDDIVLKLDNNNDEAGVFRIRNSEDTDVFTVNESGVVRVNENIVHNSDRRLKTNIENLNYGLKEILQLQPKQYFWKNQEQNKKSLGLIAQDVQTVINEIVITQDDEIKTLGVSYTELIPVLINAIKEQQATIDALKTHVSQQKNTITNQQEMSLAQAKTLESLLKRVNTIEQITHK